MLEGPVDGPHFSPPLTCLLGLFSWTLPPAQKLDPEVFSPLARTRAAVPSVGIPLARTRSLADLPFPPPFVLQGDSGGPLICDGVLQGITSWGHIPCGSPDMPVVYTKLIPYLQWIKETMSANS